VRHEHERLEALVGRWKTQGWAREPNGAPPSRIDAVDTYEWLPGGFALLHCVHARIGGRKLEGAEIIGYDPARGTYVSQYFGTDGPGAYEASLREAYGGLVWSMRSETEQFTGMFSDDGDRIEGHWELLDDDAGWRPWMDVTLTKES
jgi:hypothetical protein